MTLDAEEDCLECLLYEATLNYRALRKARKNQATWWIFFCVFFFEKKNKGRRWKRMYRGGQIGRAHV